MAKHGPEEAVWRCPANPPVAVRSDVLCWVVDSSECFCSFSLAQLFLRDEQPRSPLCDFCAARWTCRARTGIFVLGLVLYVIAYARGGGGLVIRRSDTFAASASVFLVAESSVQHVLGKRLSGAWCVLGAGGEG